MTATPFNYPGTELDIFAGARTWKGYFRLHMREFLRGRVLEVGAGIGANTRLLRDERWPRWTCLEPDASLAARLQAAIAAQPGEFPGAVEVVVGFVDRLDPKPLFDTILYIDVLEHIEDDAEELRQAAIRLAPGGSLIVLSPALPWLYSPFDRAIGHFRRYGRGTLRAAVPCDLELVRLRYLDSVGLLASLANRLVLRSPAPSQKQIQFWDQRLVPLSRLLDPLFGYRAGKSIVGIWKRPEIAEG